MAIQERRYYTQWREQQWLRWQTSTLAMFIAASTPMAGDGEVNELLEQAIAVGDAPGTARAQPEHTHMSGTTEPPEASFERFMGSFGSPRRWGGR